MIFFSYIKSFVYLIAAYLLCKVFSRFGKGYSEYYLLGSNYGKSLDDNVKELSRYLTSLNQFYFVLSNDEISRDIYLRRSSFKSYIVFFRSKGVFYSHSISDVMPHVQYMRYIFRHLRRPMLVFIQHGVIGLKLDSVFVGYLKRLEEFYDFIVASSSNEKSILLELGVNAKKIAPTGLPRFDLLHQHIDQPQVLLFLTWQSVAEFRIKSQEVVATFERVGINNDDYELIVVEHPMMLNDVMNEGSFATISNEIRKSSLLITDNSSVAWDFWYKNSNVIFFKPNASYHTNCKDLVEKNVSNNIAQLEESLLSWMRSPLPPPKIDWFYHDTNNSKRVFALLSDKH